MKNWVSVFLFFTGLTAHTQIITFDKPPVSPAIFAEGIVSTKFSERDFALSPDGSEIFYTLQSPAQGTFQTILHLQKNPNGAWSQPEVAPFAGRYSDLEPAFSADGKKLFFCSNRPLIGTGVKDFDIWVVEKKNGKWGEPQNAGTVINTKADEFYPSVALNGNLYYTAAYSNAVGREDIYISRLENGTYTTPVPLDSNINSAMYEFNAFVSPDERFILFTSYGRKDDKGRGDLYISTKDTNGNWQPAKNLELLNSDRLDYCPFVSFDKKILFFTSEKHSLQKSFTGKPATYASLVNEFSSPYNGGGNIYWVNFEEVLRSVK